MQWPPCARVLGVGAVAASAGLALVSCGAPSASKTLELSVTSGAVGTRVTVSGHAGGGCVPGHNWFGFNFERYGELAKGPATQMTTPVQTNGAWSASFVVPSFMGGSAARGPGAPVVPGRYELVAPACTAHVLAVAPFEVTPPAPTADLDAYVGIAATVDGQGYWLVQADGTVAAYGDARNYGSLPAGRVAPSSPIVGIARTYSGRGYWLVSTSGHVYSFGDARPYGSLPAGASRRAPITGMAVNPDGKGYWLVNASGHVYSFGNARSHGMPNDYSAPYDAIGTRPAGGYIITAATNAATYAFPGGVVEGGGPGTALSATLVGTAVTPSGNGTWQAGTDGGVITTGDASFYGSVPGEGITLSAPITAIAGDPDGHGYWLLGADGSVFAFGDAKTHGSPGPGSATTG